MKPVNWNSELENLVATAKTPEEQAATQAFAKAIGPYLENPEMLRTLLGKIQAPVPAEAFGIVVGQKHFKNMDEVKAKLPHNVEIVGLK